MIFEFEQLRARSAGVTKTESILFWLYAVWQPWDFLPLDDGLMDAYQLSNFDGLPQKNGLT